ncbi:MAG: hypothetical protein BGO31_20325 [Bacteroidetes bacterium 43-16]|nr:MAG: hypothetical protein BGO31_20325 [Bacteroidetes bacterium 43-16]
MQVHASAGFEKVLNRAKIAVTFSKNCFIKFMFCLKIECKAKITNRNEKSEAWLRFFHSGYNF